MHHYACSTQETFLQDYSAILKMMNELKIMTRRCHVKSLNIMLKCSSSVIVNKYNPFFIC